MTTDPELQKIQEQIDCRKALAVKVYGLLKENGVCIADGFEILEIAKKYIIAAERKTPLP